ncbi:MAG: DUF362 domain-containing protein [Verrucomicrobiota bacterium]
MKKDLLVWAFCLVCALPPSGRGQEALMEEGLAARAKVVVVQDPRATAAFEPQPSVVQDMMTRGILKFTGKENVVEAWRAIVSTQDVVGIKVYSLPGPASGTRPAVVIAVIKGLLATGLPSSNIIIWDRQLADLRAAGFDEVAQHYDVRLAGAANRGYDEKAFYDNEFMGNLTAGDLEFDTMRIRTGRKSHVSKLVTTDMTKIITVTPLLNHNTAGVTGNLYSLAMGSVDNELRFESQPARLARAVPEIYALTNLSDHVVLSITDALIGQYQGEHLSALHYSTPVNQIWISKDPVALDVLAIQELDRERAARQMTGEDPNMELYHNASILELGVSAPAQIHIELVK